MVGVWGLRGLRTLRPGYKNTCGDVVCGARVGLLANLGCFVSNWILWCSCGCFVLCDVLFFAGVLCFVSVL